jgi:hypothetical protein
VRLTECGSGYDELGQQARCARWQARVSWCCVRLLKWKN